MFDGTYDPTQQDLIIGTIQVVGYVEGSFIKAARDEEAFTKKKGSDGRGARSRNANTAGKITFTLMASSPSNDALQALADLDYSTGQGVVSSFVKDRSSKQGFCQSQNGWIIKPPDYERQKELGEIEWVVDCDDIEIKHSGLATAVGP